MSYFSCFPQVWVLDANTRKHLCYLDKVSFLCYGLDKSDCNDTVIHSVWIRIISSSHLARKNHVFISIYVQFKQLIFKCCVQVEPYSTVGDIKSLFHKSCKCLLSLMNCFLSMLFYFFFGSINSLVFHYINIAYICSDQLLLSLRPNALFLHIYICMYTDPHWYPARQALKLDPSKQPFCCYVTVIYYRCFKNNRTSEVQPKQFFQKHYTGHPQKYI